MWKFRTKTKLASHKTLMTGWFFQFKWNWIRIHYKKVNNIWSIDDRNGISERGTSRKEVFEKYRESRKIFLDKVRKLDIKGL